jgi:chorismate synthase
MRDVLERASARETAMRVALASVARVLLTDLGLEVASRVVSIGAERDDSDASSLLAAELNARADVSPVRCLDPDAAERMIAAIDAARAAGDTLGGIFEVRTSPLPVGLGSYAQWDRRLEGELARMLMSLNAIKGVEIGMGFEAACKRGSQVHDPIVWDAARGRGAHPTNRSGGIDGGVTTGEPLVLRAAMKPISTLMSPLPSIDVDTGAPAAAHIERSDVCAVPAAAVIAESLVALVLADAVLRRTGGDSMAAVRSRL